MIKMIMLTFLFVTSFSAIAENRFSNLFKKPTLKREKAQVSDASIQGDFIVIHFGQKNLHFSLPLRPDLEKRAGDKLKPYKLSPYDQSIQDYADYVANQKVTLDPSKMSRFQRAQMAQAQDLIKPYIDEPQQALALRKTKHDEKASELKAAIDKTYEQYDQMSADEKTRANEIRRRILKGLSRLLSSQFKAGTYQVGESSIDSLPDESKSEDFAIPSFKEKWVLKTLETFNIQLFGLGKRLVTTNEYGWVIMGAPVFVVPKFGHMYMVSLHVGYNVSDDRVYIRVSTSHQKADIVGGFTIGILPSALGFYAATVDVKQKYQEFDISTYNPPSIPAVGIGGREYAGFSSVLPGLPIGGTIIPTTLPPYPLSELMFFTTSGKLKMRALGSFALRKFRIFSKSKHAPAVIEEITPMPEKKKQNLIKNVLGLATFWKTKSCELSLTPVTSEVVVKN